MVRVGINGFGRIGRLVLRATYEYDHTEVEVVAVNDPFMGPEQMAYLLKHDSTFGEFKEKVTFDEENLIINEKYIKVYTNEKISEIPWGDSYVEYVIESSGVHLTYESNSQHIHRTNGAKRYNTIQ
jgi:glyceraldehyde 3-phosphate dehydrogenase